MMTRSARPARRVGCVSNLPSRHQRDTMRAQADAAKKAKAHANNKGKKVRRGVPLILSAGATTRAVPSAGRAATRVIPSTDAPRLAIPRRPSRSEPLRRRRPTTQTRRARATTTTRRTTGARGGVEITRPVPDSPVDVAQARNRRKKLRLLRRRCDRRRNSRCIIAWTHTSIHAGSEAETSREAGAGSESAP